MSNDERLKIYHYTNLEACESILKSNILRATHYTHLNDTTELVFSRHFLEESLRNAKRKHECYPKKFLDMIYKKFLPVSYVTSFCGHFQDTYESENGLLSMWRGYGNGNGVAIVFNKENLEERLTREMKAKKATFMSDLVEYTHKNEAPFLIKNEELHKYFETIQRWFEWFCELDESKDKGMTDKYLEKNSQEIGGALLNLLFRIKHKGFKEEIEYRLGVFNFPERFPPKDKHYIEINFDLKSTIENIIIGPGRDREKSGRDLISSIKSLFNESKLAKDFVKYSETPYLPLHNLY